jgi:hypothetical protein
LNAESADELLVELRRLVAEGRIKLAIDAKRLHHIDSPVSVEADGNVWAYGAVGLAALALLWRGPLLAAAALAAGILIYLTLGRLRAPAHRAACAGNRAVERAALAHALGLRWGDLDRARLGPRQDLRCAQGELDGVRARRRRGFHPQDLTLVLRVSHDQPRLERLKIYYRQ